MQLRALVETRHVHDDTLVRAFADALRLVVGPDAERESVGLPCSSTRLGRDAQADGRGRDMGDVRRVPTVGVREAARFDCIERGFLHKTDHDRGREDVIFPLPTGAVIARPHDDFGPVDPSVRDAIQSWAHSSNMLSGASSVGSAHFD